MPKPMSIYRPETIRPPEHSFKEIRGKRIAYHKYGDLATYVNITQAERKLAELKLLGYDCYRTFNYPFLILLNQNNEATI